MNESTSLLGLLQEWREAGEVEGAGIQTGDWAKVAQCQQRKGELREIISALRRGSSDPLTTETLQTALRELVAQELRNSDWLNQRRARLLAEKSRAQSATGNLRRVRSAYGGPRPSSVWNSYS